MKRFSFLSFVVFFSLIAAPAVFSAENQTQQYIVRFKNSPRIAQGMSHSGCISAMQSTCHKNIAVFSRTWKGKKVTPLWIINACVTQASDAELKKIRSLENVAEVLPVKYRIWIEPNVKSNPVDPNQEAVQWSIQKVRAPEVWKQLKIDGSGVVVGHLDTGVDGEHPALKGKILKFKDFTNSSDPDAPALRREDGVPYDDQGHGTHTAGSIAGGNGIGVAPGARLIVGKIFDQTGGATDAGLLAAMQWVMDPDGDPKTNDGPRLVSNSWGSDAATDRSFWDAVQAWVNAGIVPVFAGGNAGPSGKVGTPGGYPHAWAVGATTKTDTIANFSSVGPVFWDGKSLVKPDISAPGANVISAAIGGGLVSNSGTSMACPHVAGLAALMFQANPKLTVDQVRAIAESTSIDLGTAGKDNKFGTGRIDAFACVKKVLETTASSISEAFVAYGEALDTEKALIGIQPETPLSGPLANSIVTRGMEMDDGEFRTLSAQVSDLPSAKIILDQLETARRHSAIYQ